MPAIPIVAAVVVAGGGVAAAKIAANGQKNAASQGAASAASTQEYRQQQLDKMFGGGGPGTGFNNYSQSPYSRSANPVAPGFGGPPDVRSQGYSQVPPQGGGRPGPYEGTYFKEGDPRGMFHNADGSIDWAAGTGPAWLQNSAQYERTGLRPIGRKPPNADDVAERHTRAWRDAQGKMDAWEQQNLAAGRTLRDLGKEPVKGGGMSAYMRYGDYKAPAGAPTGPGSPGPDSPVTPEHPYPGQPQPGDPGGPVGPGGPGGPGGYSGMYDYAGPEDVYGNSETGGDYGLARMYQGLLGNSAKSSAVLAPQIQALQEQKEGQARVINATMTGGQRDRALANLEKTFSSSLGQLRQGLIGSSMQGLQSLYGTQLGDATQRYGIDTSADTARYGIDAQSATAAGQLGLGYANLGQQGYQFDKNFGQNAYEWENNFGLQKLNYLTGSSQWDQNFNAQQQAQQAAASKDKWGQIGGTISGLAGAYLQNKANSSNRVNYNYGTPSGGYNWGSNPYTLNSGNGYGL